MVVVVVEVGVAVVGTVVTEGEVVGRVVLEKKHGCVAFGELILGCCVRLVNLVVAQPAYKPLVHTLIVRL